MNLSMKLFYHGILLLILAFSKPITAQLPVFVPMDDSVKLMVRFYETDSVVVVLPDGYKVNPEDSTAICNFVFWKEKPVYLFMHESSLTPGDYSKHLKFFGPCYKFSGTRMKETPFQIEKTGFSISGRHFNGNNDAFYYINSEANRVYACRNGENQPLAYLGYMAGPYQFYVFSGNNIVYSGFDAVAGINDMDKLRQENFGDPLHNKFADFYISVSITDTSGFCKMAAEYDKFVGQLCYALGFDASKLPRFSNYFYGTMNELRLFIAMPAWSEVHGKSFGDINHITGLNMEILKHETGHTIIGHFLGKAPSAFFDEGFRQATDYFFSSEAFERDKEVFRKNHRNLTTELITGEPVLFFRGMENYSIAGVFVHKLIQIAGIEKFKSAYSNHTIDSLIAEHGYSWDMLIEQIRIDLSVPETRK